MGLEGRCDARASGYMKALRTRSWPLSSVNGIRWLLRPAWEQARDALRHSAARNCRGRRWSVEGCMPTRSVGMIKREVAGLADANVLLYRA